MKNNKRNIITAVALSLAVHLAAGTVFFYKTSDNIGFPRSLNKLNLVWVALQKKNETSKDAAVPRSLAAIPRRDAEKNKTSVERPPGENITLSGETAEFLPALDISETVILTGYNEPAAAGEKQIHSSTANAAAEAGNKPVSGTVDAYPLYRENTPPVYPEVARIRGYEGVVLVAAEILPDGSVGGTKIRKSSGYTVLDQSAVEAVKPWKFEPARKSGKPFAVWVELPIKFVLQNDNSQS